MRIGGQTVVPIASNEEGDTEMLDLDLIDLDSCITSDAAAMTAMPPPVRPRLGSRTSRRSIDPESVAPPPRFVPRTMADESSVPDEPEAAATHLGLTGPSEAKELGELAQMFSTGQEPSCRPASLLAGKAAAKAAVSAAAEAVEAAAAASAKVALAKQAASRAAAGLIEVTPRTRAAADELLTLNLQAALDEAATAKQRLEAELASAVTSAIEKDLADAFAAEPVDGELGLASLRRSGTQSARGKAERGKAAPGGRKLRPRGLKPIATADASDKENVPPRAK